MKDDVRLRTQNLLLGRVEQDDLVLQRRRFDARSTAKAGCQACLPNSGRTNSLARAGKKIRLGTPDQQGLRHNDAGEKTRGKSTA